MSIIQLDQTILSFKEEVLLHCMPLFCKGSSNHEWLTGYTSTHNNPEYLLKNTAVGYKGKIYTNDIT